MQELHAGHTHLYPGARGRCQSPLEDGPALLEFSDGVAVASRIGGDRLEVAGYTTAAGTAIPAKVWRLELTEEGFRIRARAE